MSRLTREMKFALPRITFSYLLITPKSAEDKHPCRTDSRSWASLQGQRDLKRGSLTPMAGKQCGTAVSAVEHVTHRGDHRATLQNGSLTPLFCHHIESCTANAEQHCPVSFSVASNTFAGVGPAGFSSITCFRTLLGRSALDVTNRLFPR